MNPFDQLVRELACQWDVLTDPDFDMELFRLDMELTSYDPPAYNPEPIKLPIAGVKLA